MVNRKRSKQSPADLALHLTYEDQASTLQHVHIHANLSVPRSQEMDRSCVSLQQIAIFTSF